MLEKPKFSAACGHQIKKNSTGFVIFEMNLMAQILN
jgi:hypothetical protein